MSRVRIPPVLRSATGGQKEVQAQGSTLGELVSSLAHEHPDLQGKILQPDGALSRYLNVYVNDQDVRLLQGLETPVGGEDTVTILPAMSGGSPALRRPRRPNAVVDASAPRSRMPDALASVLGVSSASAADAANHRRPAV